MCSHHLSAQIRVLCSTEGYTYTCIYSCSLSFVWLPLLNNFLYLLYYLILISTLGQLLPNCEIYSDALNHASMIMGVKHSKSKKYIWKHNDLEHLEELLQKGNPDAPKVILFESGSLFIFFFF